MLNDRVTVWTVPGIELHTSHAAQQVIDVPVDGGLANNLIRLQVRVVGCAYKVMGEWVAHRLLVQSLRGGIKRIIKLAVLEITTPKEDMNGTELKKEGFQLYHESGESSVRQMRVLSVEVVLHKLLKNVKCLRVSL